MMAQREKVPAETKDASHGSRVKGSINYLRLFTFVLFVLKVFNS